MSSKIKIFKKGVTSPVTMLLLVLVIAVGFLIAMQFRGASDAQKTLATIPQAAQAEQPIQAGQPIQPVSLVEDVTVTFSSWDAYSRTTNAGTGHRIISAGDNLKGGDVNLQVNDDATKTYSPGQAYRVFLGNLTEALTCGGYYPTLAEGIFPDKGTFSVSDGQYAVACPNEMTFTFFDETDTATTTAQAISSGAKTTVAFQVKAPDNACLGNPSTGGINLATYWYNSTVVSKVVQLKDDGSDEPVRSTPNSATRNVTVARAGIDKVSYDYPIVCDNKLLKKQVRLETVTGAVGDAVSNDNVNITLSDISYDFNADTLDVIVGFVDEGNTNLGFVDAIVGSLIIS